VSRAPASATATTREARSAGAHQAPKRRARSAQRPKVPERPGRARVIAIANQKGGVGKSTTAVSLGAALAEIGYRVLVADLDPQGNASTGLGIRHEARDATVYDVVVTEADIHEAIVPTPVERLHAVPATIDLAGAEIELVSQFSRETRLKKALGPVTEGMYDFILLDCPPSLGLLTINALTAAEELIVPIQCEYYALEGLGQLLRNVSLVQQNINAELRLSGIVMTMFDPRTKLSEQVVQEVQRYFGDLVYGVIIPRTVRLSEAPGFGQPITVYDGRSRGAAAYRELAREVALRPPPDTPMPTIDDLPAAVTIEHLPRPSEEPEPGAEAATQVEPVEPSPAEAPDPDAAVEGGEERREPTEVRDAGGLARERTETTPTSDPSEAREGPAGSASARDATRAARREGSATDVGPIRPEDSVRPVEARVSPPPTPPTPVGRPDERGWSDPQGEREPRVRRPSTPAVPGRMPERRVVVLDEEQPDLDIEAGREEPAARPPEPPTEPGMAEIGATLEEEPVRKRRWRMFRRGDR
jgi:chromosome partitioning protein